MTNNESSWLTVGDRDCWPFVRILIVAFSLGAAGHLWLGWRLDLRHLLAMPGQVLGVLSILAMISFVLADLYLLIFAIPLYIVAVLNDWFYSASRWVCGTVLAIRSSYLLTLGGLCGEILLFGGLGVLLRRMFLLL